MRCRPRQTAAFAPRIPRAHTGLGCWGPQPEQALGRVRLPVALCGRSSAGGQRPVPLPGTAGAPARGAALVPVRAGALSSSLPPPGRAGGAPCRPSGSVPPGFLAWGPVWEVFAWRPSWGSIRQQPRPVGAGCSRSSGERGSTPAWFPPAPASPRPCCLVPASRSGSSCMSWIAEPRAWLPAWGCSAESPLLLLGCCRPFST